MNVPLYKKENSTGVLISYGFGAGWSTWNKDYPELAYDKRVIEFWLSHKDDKKFNHDVTSYEHNDANSKVLDFLRSLEYVDDDAHICLLGWDDIDLEFVPNGQLFRIDEYDGAESIELFDDSDGWMKFD